jgi:hypothetical protein
LSGLYHTQSRYYSPTFGRFLSADAGLSPNPFTYAGDNPVNAIDPTGAAEGPPPVCSGWCAVAQTVITDILVESIEQGNILKGIEDFIQSFFDPFNIFGNWFGGGGSAQVIPPGYYRHAHYAASFSIGCSAVTPNMEDSAHIYSTPSAGAALDFVVYSYGFRGSVPNLPDNPSTSPGPGLQWRGRNWWHQNSKNSLHPDDHPPKGPHYDWSQQGLKGKYSLRRFGNGIQFWDQDLTVPDWVAIEELLPFLLP